MKFLVDAQLPRRLARDLAAAGHEALHCLDLPMGNRTPDEDIARLADQKGRVVITKDSDFVTSFLLSNSPSKLLLISRATSPTMRWPGCWQQTSPHFSRLCPNTVSWN